MYAQSLICVQLFTILWIVACQTPLFMEFSRQESWSGLLFPSPGDLPDPEIQPRSPVLLADILPSEPPWNISTRDSSNCVLCIYALNKFLFTRGTDSNLKKNYTSD